MKTKMYKENVVQSYERITTTAHKENNFPTIFHISFVSPNESEITQVSVWVQLLSNKKVRKTFNVPLFYPWTNRHVNHYCWMQDIEFCVLNCFNFDKFRNVVPNKNKAMTKTIIISFFHQLRHLFNAELIEWNSTAKMAVYFFSNSLFQLDYAANYCWVNPKLEFHHRQM